MDARFWLIQAFNGISYGALLFLVGSGLSLIFGVMRIVNLAHGSYFLLGGYVALTVIWTTGSWLLAIPVAALAIALIGLRDGARVPAAAGVRPAAPGAVDGRLRVPLPAGRARHLERQQFRHQSAGGADQERRDRRHLFSAVSHVHDRHWRSSSASPVAGDGQDPHGRGGARDRGRRPDGARRRHRYFPRLHVHIRPRRLPGGTGRRDRRGFLSVYPGLDFEILPLAFAVVIIGGMGSLGGAAIGAVLVGSADNFGKALFPEISYFTLYAPMALILAVKPTGLFGRE